MQLKMYLIIYHYQFFPYFSCAW